ncbi:hypothetical protein GDO86_006954 [Hymenochirus boettgeri]|uniref:Nuclear factor interleukin-3-regulated protein n=1 Tax=Hymenochirus boettgeri TaxID=247094 RepID=A0A8T2JG17_9PIPI|nr:hypothetical protein GDO86_006954 [Hymenochirus boettgeri]
MESPLLPYSPSGEEQRVRVRACGGSSGAGRRKREFISDEKKDASYWEKRKKNNEAAKRSREKRRFHDLVLEGKVQALDEENGRLRSELLQLKLRFGLISAASFLESGKGLGNNMTSEPTSLLCSGENGTYTSSFLGMNSDSSEADSGGGAAMEGYSPCGSLSDLSDQSSRDSPEPGSYMDGRTTDSEFAHMCPSVNQSAAMLSAPRGGVILYRMGGLTVDPQQRQREDDDFPSYALLASQPLKCSTPPIRPPIFAHADPSPPHYQQLLKAALGNTEPLDSPKSNMLDYHSEDSADREGGYGYGPPEDPPHQESSPGVKLPHKLRLKGRPHGQESRGAERGQVTEVQDCVAGDL